MLPSTTRALVHLAWPVFVGQLAVMGYGLVDTLMAGHLSPADLAAVGVGSSIFYSVFVALMGVLIALSPVVARLHGAGETAAIGEQVRQSAWLALFLALPCGLLLVFPEPFLALSRLQPVVETKVRAFLFWQACGVPALLLFRVPYGWSTAVSLPRPMMVFQVLGLLIKLPLNVWFMYGGLGVAAQGGAGCAMASAVTAWVVLGLTLWWVRREAAYRPYGVFERWSWPDPKLIARQLKLGLPIGATFLVDVTAYTFMALFIARLGPDVSAAHQVAANLGALCFMLPASLGHAAAVLVGQALGAGEARQARVTGFVAIAMGLAAALPVCGALWFGRAWIAGFYVTDGKVAAIAAGLISLVACYHFFDALQAVAVNVLRGYHRTVMPMLIYATALWGLGLGGGYVLGLTNLLGPLPAGLVPPLGAPGFWLAAIGSLGVAGGLVTVYLERVSRCRVQ